jgi:hypothetical protein
MASQNEVTGVSRHAPHGDAAECKTSKKVRSSPFVQPAHYLNISLSAYKTVEMKQATGLQGV